VLPAVPRDAEVIAAWGIMGRFADRRLVFPFLDIGDRGQQVPVYGRTVVVILTDQGFEYASAAGTASAVVQMQKLHAAPIANSDGVHAFVWHPPKGTDRLVIPPVAS
jgi:hypothetical protein